MKSDFSIASEIKSERLYDLRPGRWLVDLLVDYAVIAACFLTFHWTRSILLVPLLSIIVGARMHALALLGHDSTHRLAFRTRWLNDLLCNLFIAWPLGVVMTEGYRPWHFHHHRVLGTEEDPELSYRGLYPYVGQATWSKALLFFAFDLTGLGIGGLFRFMKAIFPYKKPSTMLGPIVFWTTFAVTCSYLNATWIFLLWAWCLVTGFWAVFRFRTWTEHVDVPMRGDESTHRFSANAISRFFFFPHNTHCHYEHHKWPQIPYYHLPRLRALEGNSHPVIAFSTLFPWSSRPRSKMVNLPQFGQTGSSTTR